MLELELELDMKTAIIAPPITTCDSPPQPLAATRRAQIGDRETEYQKRKKNQLSPDRIDHFNDRTPAPNARGFGDIMMETNLERAEANIRRNIEKKAKEDAELKSKGPSSSSSSTSTSSSADSSTSTKKGEAKKRGRWDATPQDTARG